MASSDALKGKYTEFLTHYADLNEADIIEYKQLYPEEGEKMTSYIMQVREEGIQQGMQQGMELGERSVLLKLLKRRFAKEAQSYESKVAMADQQDLERWLDNILDADTIEDVFG